MSSRPPRSSSSPSPRTTACSWSRTRRRRRPGLAFLLATVAQFGEDGWRDYWERLRANDVEVVDRVGAGVQRVVQRRRGRGDRPLVVSYASSPPAAVYFSDPQPASRRSARCSRAASGRSRSPGSSRAPSTAERPGSCVDFMLAERFQADIPLQMFVFPARDGTPLPDVFTRFAELPRDAARAATRRPSVATASAGSTSGPTPSCGERTRRRPRPRASRSSASRSCSSASSSSTPSSRSSAAGSGRAASSTWTRSARSSATRRRCEVALVHGLAGRAVDGAHAAGRAPRRVRAHALPLPGPRPRPRARGRPVRAADGGRRHGVPRARRRAARSARSCSRTSSSTTRSWSAPSAGSGRTSTRTRRRRRGCSARAACARSSASRCPRSGPAIVAAAAIVFLFCFTSFGVILVLGGPTRSTLETEIYRQTATLLDLPHRRRALDRAARRGRGAARRHRADRAAARVARRASGPPPRSSAAAGTARRPRAARRQPRVDGGAARGTGRGARGAVVRHRSGHRTRRTTARSASLDARQRAVRAADRGDLRTRCRYAAIATVIAVVVGGLRRVRVGAVRARRGGSTRRSRCPLGVSAVTVGFGFLIALDEPPLDLRTSWVLVPIAQALVALPFVVRIIAPVLRAIDPRLREAAAVLGASPRRVWREVDLPIGARARWRSRPGSRSRSRSASSARPCSSPARRTPTLPVVIFRLLGQPGDAELRRGDGREHRADGARRRARCWPSTACAARRRGSF